MNNIKIPITKVKVRDAADMYEIMRVVLEGENKINLNQEHCWVIALNHDYRILNIELIGIGSVDQVIVRPMEVLSIPLQKSATNIVIIHNHPSGQLKASQFDKDVTDRMIWACKIMQITLLDHMIITENSYFSFEESGLMDKLKDNSNHVVPYILQKEMKKKMEIKFHENMVKITERHGEEIIKAVNRGEKDGIKKGKKEGKKEEKLEIAKSLLTMVMKHEEISKATGLSMEEINSLTKK